MLTKVQRTAYDEYRAWCAEGHPFPLTNEWAWRLVLGHLVDMTDGVPNDDERALMALAMTRIDAEGGLR